MSTFYPMYREAAQHEIARRLRAADDYRLSRLARTASSGQAAQYTRSPDMICR